MPSAYAFISYAKEDAEQVRRLYARLRNDRLSAWLDDHDLLPGYDWEHAIKSAIHRSNAFIVCLSTRAVGKTGFIQKEIREALEIAERQPEGGVFIVPIRLDECVVPERLQRWQWIDLFKRGGYKRLRRTLAAKIGQTPIVDTRSVAHSSEFANPADAILYELCLSRGRCLYGSVRRGRWGITQGHILVIRQGLLPQFKQLKRHVKEFRRLPREDLALTLIPHAPWRKPEYLVSSINSPDDENLTLRRHRHQTPLRRIQSRRGERTRRQNPGFHSQFFP